MNKSVAIPYIIAIVIGIIVLALIVYLIYKVVRTPQMDCGRCNADFTSWCRGCWAIKWIGGKLGDQALCDCVNKCGLGSCLSKDDGCDNDQLKNSCKAVGVPVE